ncbi:MAG TPA: hypothetical protein VKO45_09595 [Methanomicrobiales archaeon]|nr:hypothetical protein [Methanomicrobiales archaeon]
MTEPALNTLGLQKPLMAVTGILFLVIVLPVVIGWTAGSSPAQVIGFIGSIFLLQGLAPTVGIGLGLPPLQLFGILTSVATGIILGIFMVCDLLSGKSERITNWIRKIEATMEKYQFLHTLGEYMLIPIMWVPGIGLYGTPVIAWVLGWRSLRAVLLMLAGWLIACLSVAGMVKGVLHFIGL